MSNINLCGLECPQPVIETKKYLENNTDTASLCVVVDNKAASENVSRFLTHQGFSTDIVEKNSEFQITGKKSLKNDPPTTSKSIESKQKSTVIMFSNNTIGTGDSDLGAKLMLNFIKTLSEMKDSLWRLIFVNEGVKLTIKDAETLPILQKLEKEGVSILVCGTCLEYFNILDKKMTGETTNMLDIVTSLQVAKKVINF